MISIRRRRDTLPAECSRAARRARRRAAVLALVLVLVVACCLTAASWLTPGATGVARADDTSGAQKVSAFEDVTIGPGESWDNVVVVGGDLVVRGTVKNGVVVVGGDVTVTSGASIGHSPAGHPDDAAIVSVFGHVTVEPGANVRGRTVDVAGGVGDVAATAVADPVLRPWHTGSILSWIWSTVFLAVVAIIAVAIAPRQVAVVRDRVRHHFFSSLGWGALGAIIAVPIVTVLLIVTVIGIILVVPWLAIVLPVMFLFGFVAVGAMVGRLILGAKEDKRETLMVAAVLGVVVLNIARWIPVAGVVILGLLLLVGFGATYVSIWNWRRDKRRRMRESAAAALVAGGHASVGQTAGGPAAGHPATGAAAPGAPAAPFYGPAYGSGPGSPYGAGPGSSPGAWPPSPPAPELSTTEAPAAAPPAAGEDASSEPPPAGSA